MHTFFQSKPCLHQTPVIGLSEPVGLKSSFQIPSHSPRGLTDLRIHVCGLISSFDKNDSAQTQLI